jgi:hypothetical protein
MEKYIILSKQNFTALYRFGQIPVNGINIIVTEGDKDLFSQLLEEFKFLASFSSDEEYLVISLEVKEQYTSTICVENIIEIIPLTKAAKHSYELKFNQNIKFSDARFERLIYKVEEYIDIEEKIRGINAISKILLRTEDSNKTIVSKEIITKVREARINGKKSNDIIEDFFTHLLVYDRYEFFPNTNLGYFYDIGEVFAHSKGAKTFKGSGLYEFLETNKRSLFSEKLLKIINFIENNSEIDSFKNQLTVGSTKRYISALFYLKFKEDLWFLGEFSGGQKKSPESVKKVTFRLWNQISYMSYC